MTQKTKDQLALEAAQDGNTLAYEAAVDAGARANPGASNRIEDLDSSAFSAYSEAKRNRDVLMMRQIASADLAAANMQLSDLEDQLLDAAQTGNIEMIAASLRGVRNPQVLDVARDIAQISGYSMAFRTAEMGGADLIGASRCEAFAGAMIAARKSMMETGQPLSQEKCDQFAKSARYSVTTRVTQKREHLQEREQGGRSHRRRTRSNTVDLA